MTKLTKPSEVTDTIDAILADCTRINKAFASLLDCCLENYGDLPLAVMNEVARTCERVKVPLSIDEMPPSLNKGIQNCRPDLNEYGDDVVRYQGDNYSLDIPTGGD